MKRARSATAAPPPWCARFPRAREARSLLSTPRRPHPLASLVEGVVGARCHRLRHLGLDLPRHPRDGRGRARRCWAPACASSSAGVAMLAFLAARGRDVRVSRRGLLRCRAPSASCCSPAATAWSRSPSRTCPAGLPRCSSPRCRCGSSLLRFTVARERVARGTLGGLAVGFCGLGRPPAARQPAGRRRPLGGVLLVLVAAASWAGGSFLSPRLSMPLGPAGLDRLADGRRRRGAPGRRDRGRRARPAASRRASTKSLLAFALPGRRRVDGSPSPPTPGCCRTCRSRRSRPTPTSTRSSPWYSAGRCSSEQLSVGDAGRRRAHRGLGGGDRHPRVAPPDPSRSRSPPRP